MTTGIQCTADARRWHPARAETAICSQHRRQAQLAQMRQSPSAAVRAAAWLLTQLHQPEREAGRDGPQHRRPSHTTAPEAEPG